MNKKYVLFLLFNFFWFYAFTQIDVNSYVNGDVIVAKISVRGNVKTEVSIVLRELEFHENEIVAINQLDTLIAKTENNLINSKLFNFAHIEKTFSNDSVYLDIQLIERWYTWVFPVFELADGNFNTWWETKDFDRVDYGLLFTQENFRGRRETIKLKAISGFNEYLNIVYEIPYMSESKHFGIRLETEVSRRHN
ncbi:MAG: hypothetical protein U9R32_05205, partial [Bacteroidota bacterium]|nr:hypothetical protein [Bacteroidota bacterium]